MGLAYYISIDHPDISTDHISGKAVARAMGDLNLWTEELELPSLEQFLGQSMAEMAELVGEEIDPEEVAIAGPQWFDPNDGLRVVQALLQGLADKPDRIDDSAEVVADLEAYRDVLLQAVQSEARWHLSVDL